MKVEAIVPAAGAGLRMGGDVRKQFMDLGGEPMFLHTLRRLASAPLIQRIILAAPEEELDPVREAVERAGLPKPCKVVTGGATRQESVAKAFGHLDPASDLVMVHDGVRPFVTMELVERVAQAAAKVGAATAACRARDTLKKELHGRLVESISRDGVVHIHTPQCFRYSLLAEALERAEMEGATATDESSLVQRLGMDVAVVHSPYWNIKVTTAEDMTLAEALERSMVG
ncbi:MAG: 2-C-methyl-D-erythritol 4-phosphate cytidylyltransferase [Nitrospinota bacterium]|nr:2-C-methyl-D-erythritol 4-phosphate cytidylyltransferase [Nitrospinota bacterium]